jgi:GTP-binding protein HflX
MRDVALQRKGRSNGQKKSQRKDLKIKIEIENRERAIIVGLVYKDQNRSQVNEYLDELELLADTAGAEVVERIIQERRKIDPTFFIGRGKAQELAMLTKYLDADLVIFDDDLSPAQAKNIEELCQIKVVDRSGLILDIFAKHARTREARIQVEMAQLKYLSTRLTGQWSHLSRQVGGIGVRGPGETQLEVDRRAIKKRIGILDESLKKIAKQRSIRRKVRQDEIKAALIGYTNVGKSTLLNALTKADVLVKDQLFATLDPTIRSMSLSDHRRVLLIDTVGFIRKLPHHLVASFKSTLEEVHDADVLLHIIDISHLHYVDQMNTVDVVLKELELNQKPILKVFNKIDALSDASLISSLRETEEPCVFISASKGIFLNELRQKITSFIDPFTETMHVTVPIEQTVLLPQLYQLAKVLKIEYDDSHMSIILQSSKENVSKITNLFQTK